MLFKKSDDKFHLTFEVRIIFLGCRFTCGQNQLKSKNYHHFVKIYAKQKLCIIGSFFVSHSQPSYNVLFLLCSLVNYITLHLTHLLSYQWSAYAYFVILSTKTNQPLIKFMRLYCTIKCYCNLQKKWMSGQISPRWSKKCPKINIQD